MATERFNIGQRVNIRGRGRRVFSIIDIDSRNGRAKVIEFIQTDIGLTNGDAEWVDYNTLQKHIHTYTQITYYPNIRAYKKAYNKFEENVSDHCKRFLQMRDTALINAIRTKNPEYYPIPNSAPANIEEQRAKTEFNQVQMDFYNQFKKDHIDDFLHDLKFESQAEIEQDKFVYNDRGLGEFDFAKASNGLNKRFEYYSKKHKKVVPFNEVKILGTERNYTYELKSDGSEVIIREELGSNGKPRYYSTVKKCYLMKEKVPREKNAVRIFLYQGGSGAVTGDGVLYPAMTAIALTEILESIGYSVSFVTGWDASQHLSSSSANRELVPESQESTVRTGIYKKGEGWVDGERYVMYSVKDYDEVLNVPELLYLTGDPALYLWDFFKGMYITFDRNKDKYQGIGYLGYVDNWQRAVYTAFLPRDVNKGVIYITLKDIESISDVKQAVRNVILYAEALNKDYREREEI